jgi:predicted transcriptional regulator
MGVFSALLRRITEFIEVFKRKEDIFRIVGDASPIGIYKALKVLRELKQKKREADRQQGQPFNPLPYAF